MIALGLSLFRPLATPERRMSPVSEKRAAPVFIGDAVQPCGGETLLLALLRREAGERDTDQS